MAKLETKATIETWMTLRISECEARALDALAGYGTKNFLDCFYKHMGRHYLEPHEQGIVTLFKCIQKELPTQLYRAKKAREALDK